MSKVVISVDTEAKTISASVEGGETVDNLDSISVHKYTNYQDNDEVELRFYKAEKRGELKVITSYCMAQINNTIQFVSDKVEAAKAQIANILKGK